MKLTLFKLIILILLLEIIFAAGSHKIASFEPPEDYFKSSENPYEDIDKIVYENSPTRYSLSYTKPLVKLLVAGRQMHGLLNDMSFFIDSGILEMECSENCTVETGAFYSNVQYDMDEFGEFGNRLYYGFSEEMLNLKDDTQRVSIGNLNDLFYTSMILFYPDNMLGNYFFTEQTVKICTNASSTNQSCEDSYFDKTLKNRREEFGEFVEYRNEKSRFFKTFWDERKIYSEGVRLLSYHHSINSTMIVTSAIGDELDDSKIKIDDTEYRFDIEGPVIFIDNVNLETGVHTVEIVSAKKTYDLEFYVDTENLAQHFGLEQQEYD